MRIIDCLSLTLQDARQGLRQLRKNPAVVAVVVLSLTIGLGANSAIFTLVDAAILKPLPVKNPADLRIVEWTSSAFSEGVRNMNGDFEPMPGGRFRGSTVGANLYRRLAREQTAFEALVGISDFNPVAIAVDASTAEQVGLQYVSANFFQGLDAPPIIGRPFLSEEDRVGNEPVVIVSHRFWARWLEGRAGLRDREIRINNVPARIVGVAPTRFFGLRAGEWTDVYAPLAMRAAFQPGGSRATARGEDDRDWWVRLVGRLKPGVSEEAAKAELADLFRNLALLEGVKIEPAGTREMIISPGRRGFDALNPNEAKALWIMMLLVGVVLLIVCANVANLLLARSVSRQHELAVRLALGAPRIRLFRQHLIESLVLGLVGGAAGLPFGYLLVRSIDSLFRTGEWDPHLDLRILAYTGVLAILTALLFGLAPALRGARTDIGEALKLQARSMMGGRLHLPRLLMAIQIGLCLTALVGAGLLGRSLRNLKLVDVGFDRENLAYASVNPWQAGYSPERVAAYADRVREELSRLPGVLGVSAVRVRPLQGGGALLEANIHGRLYEPGKNRVNVNRVGSGFFETLRLPLEAGRTFDRRDFRRNSHAVVVDDLFARRLFPRDNPLGRRFGYGKETNRYEIVGVVRGSRYNSLHAGALPIVYHPYLPGEMTGNPIHFAIRSRLDSTRLAEAARKAIASVDRAVPMSQFHTQTDLIDRLLRTERLLGFVSAAFALVAMTLAAIGLGGLLAYAVARRTNEIGVRMALGATTGNVVYAVLRDSLGTVGAGIVIGLPSAYAVTEFLKTALFGLESLDPWTALISFASLLSVALLAAWIPARRAARIDPMTALREE
ncbi:MAG: ABC transporter permease [Bryobacterales bacterium]|nr:ABC transporter permease [Bryobacterales bacterium]